MDTNAFEAVMRAAAKRLSRRRSLLALSGAALAASMSNAGVSEAKQKGTDCKKKEKRRCANDAAACRTVIEAACDVTAPECAELLPCCDTCSANGVVTCIRLAQASAMTRLK